MYMQAKNKLNKNYNNNNNNSSNSDGGNNDDDGMESQGFESFRRFYARAFPSR